MRYFFQEFLKIPNFGRLKSDWVTPEESEDSKRGAVFCLWLGRWVDLFFGKCPNHPPKEVGMYMWDVHDVRKCDRFKFKQ